MISQEQNKVTIQEDYRGIPQHKNEILMGSVLLQVCSSSKSSD
jgi:hypothetical protein